jgi:hypothetical protein
MSRKCSAKNRNGKKCGAWALIGAKCCALHADPETGGSDGIQARAKSPNRISIRGAPLPIPVGLILAVLRGRQRQKPVVAIRTQM